MRNRVLAGRSRILGQAALVAILAAATASCSSDRFSKPFFTGSTANQREIIDGGQQSTSAIAGAPTSDVSRADLAAPVQTADLSAPSEAPYSGTGPYKWTTAGGRVRTVQSGDSLDGLAIRYGVPSNQIAIANKISNPSQLQPGMVIVIPVKTADLGAPMPKAVGYAEAEPAPGRAAGKKGGATHVVESGDTLYGIARTYGVRPSEIVRANGLANPSVQIGQTLTIPGGAGPAPKKVASAEVMSTNDPHTFGGTKVLGTLSSRDAGPDVAATSEEPVATIAMARSEGVQAPAAPTMPNIPAKSAEQTSQADANAAIDQAVEPPSTNGTSFRWPVRGRIISSFGSKPNGEKNDGINLAVPEGTSVKAAEAGTVIYAGNELEGYGNLVLIRHADGWVSAYAHNSAIKVKRGDQVRRGQSIATAGSTGSVTSPQVHFELRKGAKPVNPMDYLAGA